MKIIKLPKGIWEYDPDAQLGERGGFGTVYLGSSDVHGEIAVKKLHMDAKELAHREFRIAEELSKEKLQYVIPFLDAGQDADSENYYVVMPKAEKSLQEEIEKKGKIDESGAINILSNIASGLAEVIKFVHRDLKPGNVLYHEGRWKIADFGIARFVEESTSINTLKECLSPQYAAPEQWKYETSTNATDIYALGCIAYTLLSGNPPFLGKIEELQEKHLNSKPDKIENINPKFQAILFSMLRKDKETRPSLERVLNVITELYNEPKEKVFSEGLKAIARAGAFQAERDSAEEAKRKKEESVREKRERIAKSAIGTLREIVNNLFEAINNNAPDVKIVSSSSSSKPKIILGSASLEIDLFTGSRPIHKDTFKSSGWDVISGVTISVYQATAHPYGWGASLWYTKMSEISQYRWFEIPYMALSYRQPPDYDLFPLLNFRDADLAPSSVMHIYQHAARPKTIDDEDTPDFIDRWMQIFAKAVEGRLSNPGRLPLD